MIIDTNIVIYSIKPEFDTIRDYLVANQEILRISQITRVETLGYHKLSQQELEKFKAFFQLVPALAITDSIINEAIRLRQQRKRSLGDAIIAATARLHQLPLLTNNTVDFEDIPHLRVISLQSIS